MKNYSSYKLIKKWKKYQIDSLLKVFPNATAERLDEILDKAILDNIEVPKAIIDNNYVNLHMNFDLLGVLEWIEKVNPICAGNGVFFKNQEEALNPAAQMLIEILASRKYHKDLMKSALVEFGEGSYEYEKEDRYQGSEKVVANSYYGGSGAPSSDYFNIYTAAATTSTAQSLISTTMLAYEAFMANNIQFYNMDDCLNYIHKIEHEKYRISEDLLPMVFPEMVTTRLVSMFHEWNDDDGDILNAYVHGLDSNMLKRVYYKNNLYDFSRIGFVRELLEKIIETVDDFKDPNNVPSSIKDDMETLWGYYEQFVYCEFFQFGRIKRLKAFKRKSVVTIDTDSNMVTLQPWIDFVNNEIVSDNDIVNSRDESTNTFIMVNIMAYMLTEMVTKILNAYTKQVNIPESYRWRINMKNEFLFTTIVLTDKKKRYASSVRLREGKEIFPEKVDVKGADFVKSSACEETKTYFKKLLKDEYLSGDIDVRRILRKVEDFENVIRESIHKGEKKFLSPKNVKEIESYAKPFGQQGVRAVYLWNTVYPNKSIQLPEKIDMVKLTLDNDFELNKLKERFPDIYEIIDRKIIKNPDPEVSSKKAGVLAIPSTEEIPDWALAFTNFDAIISDNVSKFNSFLDSVTIETITTAHGKQFTNIVSI